MNVREAKVEFINRTKKGVVMFYVGTIYWLLLGLLSLFDINIKLLGICYLVGAGMLFPLGIMVSKLLNIDFIAKGNPFSNIAGVLGGMQILFAPILILVFIEHIEWLPFFIAILTGAHFLPFTALHNSKGYIFQSLGVVLYTSVIGFPFMEQIYNILPFGLSLIYFLTCLIITKEITQSAKVPKVKSL